MQPDATTPMLLLVEDNDIDVEVVRRISRRHFSDLPIVRAQNGLEALEILKRKDEHGLRTPYVVLLDINMPMMNGLELLDHLTRNGPEIEMPIYVLTTSERESDKKLAERYDVTGFLVKPLTKSLLSDVLLSANNADAA